MPKVPQGQPVATDQYSTEETLRRLDRAVRRSLTMPSRGAEKTKDSVKKPPRQTGAKRTPHAS